MRSQSPDNGYEENFTSQKIGMFCTWIFVLVAIIGWIGIGHYYQPAPADLGLEETKIWYTETYQWRIIIGCSLFYIAAGFLTPSSIQFGIMLSKIEGRYPLWSITTAASGLFICLIIFFNACAWIVSAYRPETNADVIQAFNDFSWFGFLLGWFFLALEMFATAIVELQDKREQPMVPRWFPWATLAGCFLLIGAAGPAFFKSGPFAYHGALGYYLPLAVWLIYLIMTSYYMYKELGRQEAVARINDSASN